MGRYPGPRSFLRSALYRALVNIHRPNTSRRRELERYLLTAGTAAIVDIGGFDFLSYVRISVVLAAACSFLVSTVVNFVLTSRWVFRTTPTSQRYITFLLGACSGLLVNVAVTSLCMIYLHLPRTSAKSAAIGTTFLLNFWINAHVVFRDRSDYCACHISRGPDPTPDVWIGRPNRNDKSRGNTPK
jgi:putative flippase GtrA